MTEALPLNTLQVLLVEDSPSDAALIEEALMPIVPGGCVLTHAERKRWTARAGTAV